MGKRKKATKPAPKAKAPKLDTCFDCILCEHEQCVDAVLLRSQKVGSVECRVCHVRHEMAITALDEPIDVYSNWVDEMVKVNGGEE
ncbi:hypothetical protein MMPV_009642 [Pyropia vietnamensis]